MIPTIYPGSQVILREASEPAEGEIVIFYSDGQKVIHRVYKKKFCENSRHFLTKGDSVFILDPPVPACDVLGVVSEVRENGKIKNINSPLARDVWKIIMPAQLLIGKAKRFIPFKIQKELKDILLRLVGSFASD